MFSNKIFFTLFILYPSLFYNDKNKNYEADLEAVALRILIDLVIRLSWKANFFFFEIFLDLTGGKKKVIHYIHTHTHIFYRLYGIILFSEKFIWKGSAVAAAGRVCFCCRLQEADVRDGSAHGCRRDCKHDEISLQFKRFWTSIHVYMYIQLQDKHDAKR